jgi:hypothetical protein
MRKLSISLGVLSLLAFCAQPLCAQQSDQQAIALKAAIDAQQYSFVAQRAVPLSMPSQTLQSDYELKIYKDSIVAYLPYFGKTNSFAVNSSSTGINFTSKDFKYTAQEKKKGGWNIRINFKDADDTKQMYLNISSSGYTTLQVTSQDKESISYNGNIQ